MFPIVNGEIKQWRYFNQIIQDSNIPFVCSYLHITCALINAYKEASILDKITEKIWAAQMLTLRDKENELQSRLDQLNASDKRPSWKKCGAKMISFPTLSEQGVLNIYCGNYHLIIHNSINQYYHLRKLQIRQAKSYIVEHLKPSVLYDDQFEFGVEFCSKYNDLVRARFASKHSNSKSYIATV